MSIDMDALEKDAARYRYAKKHLKAGHILPGGYYLCDQPEYWDQTIDASMQESEALAQEHLRQGLELDIALDEEMSK